jgi:hypothetical protein
MPSIAIINSTHFGNPVWFRVCFVDGKTVRVRGTMIVEVNIGCSVLVVILCIGVVVLSRAIEINL